jgi:hypothetical protein
MPAPLGLVAFTPGDNHTTCSVYAQNMAYGIDMTQIDEVRARRRFSAA